MRLLGPVCVLNVCEVNMGMESDMPNGEYESSTNGTSLILLLLRNAFEVN